MRARMRAGGHAKTGTSHSLDRRRRGVSQERERVGGGGSPVLRPVGEAGELPRGGEFVGKHGTLQRAGGLSLVSARELGGRCSAPQKDGRSRTAQVSN